MSRLGYIGQSAKPVSQKEMSLPGLIIEVEEVMAKLDFPDMKSVSKLQWKNLVNKDILKKNRETW